MFKKYCLRLPALLLSLALCCSFFAAPAFAGGETAIQTEEESVFPFTIADAVKILKYCAGMITLTPEETETLDVDFDSAITLRDAIVILKVITEGVSEYASKVRYIRTSEDNYDKYPEPIATTVIKSKIELNDYSQDGKFKEATQKYEDDYFDDNVLVLVFLRVSSGSTRHKISDIAFDAQDVLITVNPFGPLLRTDDCANWHIIVEMKKSEYVDKDIKINMSEDKTVDRMEYILNLWKYGKTWAY